MSFKQLFIDLYRLTQDKKVRLIKALTLNIVSLIFLIFVVDSHWLNSHLMIQDPSNILSKTGYFTSFLATLFGLDLIADATKLLLLSILLGLLIFLTLFSLISWVFYAMGISFLGGQLWRIWSNYHQGRDVLYNYPFTNKPFIHRHWTLEEKLKLMENKLEYLRQSYKCSQDIVNESVMKCHIVNLDSREQIEKFVTEQFTKDYQTYLENLPTPGMSTTWSYLDSFNQVCDFCYNHPIFVTLCSLAAAGLYWYLTRTPPPPVSPGDIADTAKTLGKATAPGEHVAAATDLLEEQRQATQTEILDLHKRLHAVEKVTERSVGVVNQLVERTTQIDSEMESFEKWKETKVRVMLRALKTQVDYLFTMLPQNTTDSGESISQPKPSMSLWDSIAKKPGESNIKTFKDYEK